MRNVGRKYFEGEHEEMKKKNDGFLLAN